MHSTKTPSIAAAALFGAALLLAPCGAAAQPREHHATLEGTWEVQSTLVNCDTGAPVGPPFATLHTYIGTTRGSLIEQGSRTGAPPTADRSIAHGIWERVKGRQYRATQTFYRFDAAGAPIGGNEVSRTIDLGSNGNSFTGAGAGFPFDNAGAPGPVGCIVESGRRMKFED